MTIEAESRKAESTALSSQISKLEGTVRVTNLDTFARDARDRLNLASLRVVGRSWVCGDAKTF